MKHFYLCYFVLILITSHGAADMVLCPILYKRKLKPREDESVCPRPQTKLVGGRVMTDFLVLSCQSMVTLLKISQIFSEYHSPAKSLFIPQD